MKYYLGSDIYGRVVRIVKRRANMKPPKSYTYHSTLVMSKVGEVWWWWHWLQNSRPVHDINHRPFLGGTFSNTIFQNWEKFRKLSFWTFWLLTRIFWNLKGVYHVLHVRRYSVNIEASVSCRCRFQILTFNTLNVKNTIITSLYFKRHLNEFRILEHITHLHFPILVIRLNE